MDLVVLFLGNVYLSLNLSCKINLTSPFLSWYEQAKNTSISGRSGGKLLAQLLSCHCSSSSIYKFHDNKKGLGVVILVLVRILTIER